MKHQADQTRANQDKTQANQTYQASQLRTQRSSPSFSSIIHTFIILLCITALVAIAPVAYAATSATTSSTSTAGTTPLDMVSGGDVRLSLVNQDPDPAASGDIVDLRIGVQNQGQESRNDIVVEVVPNYPFIAVPGENLVANVGTLSAYQVGADQQIMKFKLRTDAQATAGTYNLKVWAYRSGERNTHTEVTIPVRVDTRKNVQVIYVDKTVIVPGQETPVTFTITNVGKSTLNNLQFTWQNKNGVLLPVSGTAGRYIDSLGVGESVNITYTVIASTSASPDLYPLDLTLSYDDPTGVGQNTFTTTAGIYVGGGTDFDVSYEGSTNGQVSFNIANTGSNPATSVAITVPQQDGWRTSGAKTAMIGNLNKGDYTIASFNLFPTGKNLPLTIEVDYTSTKGDRITKEYTVEIDTAGFNSTGFAGRSRSAGSTSASTSSTIFTPTNIIIVLVIVAAGIYFYRRKSNSSKKK